MTPNPSPTSVADSPATALRRLAGQAHRLLRRGRPEDRDEVHALLDEIARMRRQLDTVAGDEVEQWLDRLEDEVAEMIGTTNPHSRAEPVALGGVGVA